MKKAIVRWTIPERCWIITMYEDDEYMGETAWFVTKGDYLHDSIICKIAELTDKGYTIEYKLG